MIQLIIVAVLLVIKLILLTLKPYTYSQEVYKFVNPGFYSLWHNNYPQNPVATFKPTKLHAYTFKSFT